MNSNLSLILLSECGCPYVADTTVASGNPSKLFVQVGDARGFQVELEMRRIAFSFRVLKRRLSFLWPVRECVKSRDHFLSSHLYFKSPAPSPEWGVVSYANISGKRRKCNYRAHRAQDKATAQFSAIRDIDLLQWVEKEKYSEDTLATKKFCRRTQPIQLIAYFQRYGTQAASYASCLNGYWFCSYLPHFLACFLSYILNCIISLHR